MTKVGFRHVGRGAAVLIAAGLLGAFAALLVAAQDRSRVELEQRFAVRSELAARFTESYVRELMARQRAHARRLFVDGRPSARRFEDAVAAVDLEAAVLVDDRGRLVFVWPNRPALVGSPIAAKYAHLRAALRGQPTVSQVVPSAAKGVPIVAFAIPLETPTGKRAVFSGALAPATSPLGAYLRNALPIRGAHAYLVDDSGVTVAASTNEQLRRVDPAAFAAARQATSGVYDTKGRRFFATERVDGTPWRVVVTVPESELLKPIAGIGRWAPWLVFAGFALTFCAVFVLLARLHSKSAELTAANEQLGEMARTDALTGVLNRRGFNERLAVEAARARRTASSLALVVGDLDHFKRLNDQRGHQAGDAVLTRVGAILRSSVRIVDAVARIGGEEFAVLLPETDFASGFEVAERLRVEIKEMEVPVVGRITASFGVAEFPSSGRDGRELVAAADAALYEAKRNGRNRVERSPVAAIPSPALDMS